jgi:hypothetical protein
LSGGRLGFFRAENRKLSSQVKAVGQRMENIEFLLMQLAENAHNPPIASEEPTARYEGKKNTGTHSLGGKQRKDGRQDSQITTSAITKNSHGHKMSVNQSNYKSSVGQDAKVHMRRDSTTLPLPGGVTGFQVYDNTKYVSNTSLFEYDQMS